MKGFTVYILSVLAFLLFCSKSCETDADKQARDEEAEFMATLDSINCNLSAGQPSEQTLKLLDVKAIQKLDDLSDYVQIFIDPSLDRSFRIQAQVMIRDLFISDSVMISLDLFSGLRGKCISLYDFLRSGLESQSSRLKLTFDSIVVSESLHRINDQNYSGKLSFMQRYQIPSDSNPETSIPVRKEVDIFARKAAKSFGNDTLKVWSVFLGDIR